MSDTSDAFMAYIKGDISYEAYKQVERGLATYAEVSGTQPPQMTAGYIESTGPQLNPAQVAYVLDTFNRLPPSYWVAFTEGKHDWRGDSAVEIATALARRYAEFKAEKAKGGKFLGLDISGGFAEYFLAPALGFTVGFAIGYLSVGIGNWAGSLVPQPSGLWSLVVGTPLKVTAVTVISGMATAYASEAVAIEIARSVGATDAFITKARDWGQLGAGLGGAFYVTNRLLGWLDDAARNTGEGLRNGGWVPLGSWGVI